MRLATFILLFFAAFSGAHGQVLIGNRAGLGMYQQRIEADKELPSYFTEGLTTLAAPTITVPIDVRFSRFFGLLIEPGFVQRGSRTESDGYSSTERVNSIELALLAKGTMEFGRWTPYILAGPSVTRPLTVRIAYTTTTGNGNNDEEATATADDFASYERSYVSLFAGAGVAFSIGAPRLFLDYRAMWGLTPVQRGDLTDVNGSVLRSIEIFDRGHVISIGWSIPLSRTAWRATPAPVTPTVPAP